MIYKFIISLPLCCEFRGAVLFDVLAYLRLTPKIGHINR